MHGGRAIPSRRLLSSLTLSPTRSASAVGWTPSRRCRRPWARSCAGRRRSSACSA